MPETKEKNEVLIVRVTNSQNYWNWVRNKISSYQQAIKNTFRLLTRFNGSQDPNAFHNMLEEDFKNMAQDEIKISSYTMVAPNRHQLTQRIVSIANPIVLEALRRIPRYETVDPVYFDEHPTVPKIGGGRAFNTVLEAIGMGILSAEHEAHSAFNQEMISALTLTSMDAKAITGTHANLKKSVINSIEAETQALKTRIHSSLAPVPLSIDFRTFALKILLKGFYPKYQWADFWIEQLSSLIETISDQAFRHVVNPYAPIEKLRQSAKRQLAPYLKLILSQDQSLLFSEDYLQNISVEIQEQILISLLFAGGDNIKKYLDHLFIELAKANLEAPLSKEDLQAYITETGRLYTTIYAQPGKALEDFTIQFEGKTYTILKGDEIHYSTWVANRDTKEWGEDGSEFNPYRVENKNKKLNPLATFGSGSRVCRGKTLTLTIVEYVAQEFMKDFCWQAFVDDIPETHPTEFNFNNGVQGRLEYIFRARMAPSKTVHNIPKNEAVQNLAPIYANNQMVLFANQDLDETISEEETNTLDNSFAHAPGDSYS